MGQLLGLDMKLDYEVLQPPVNGMPPIVIAVKAPKRQHWEDARMANLVGHEIGIHFDGKLLWMRVTGAHVDPMDNKQAVLHCR